MEIDRRCVYIWIQGLVFFSEWPIPADLVAMGYPSKGQGAGKSKDLQKGSPGAFDKGLKGKASKGSETKGSRDGKSLTPDLKGKGKPFPTPDKGKGKPFPTPDKGKWKPLGKKGEGKEASKDETPKTTTTPARTES